MVYTNICLLTESNKHLTGYSLLLEEQQKQLQLEVLQPDYKKQEVLVKKKHFLLLSTCASFWKVLKGRKTANSKSGTKSFVCIGIHFGNNDIISFSKSFS